MSDVNTSKLLNRVRSLIERGERVSVEDCRQLFEVKDLPTLAKLARIPRERRYGRQAFYRPARIVEYHGEDAGLFISEAETTSPEGTAELIVRCRFLFGDRLALWIERLRGFSGAGLPTTTHISPRMIAALAEVERSTPADVLTALIAAGSIFLTGAEAEIFDRETRASLAPGAISPELWLDIHRAAHRLGLKTGAAMSYGTTDWPAPYAAHLETLRSEQDRTGGFVQFVPMAIHNRNVEDFYLAAPTAAQSLKTLAIARIFLDNVPHIAAAPSLITPEVAFVGLSYGADVIDASAQPLDVIALEPHAVAVAGLPVLEGDPLSGPAPVGMPVGQIRGRIVESRWTAIPVDASLLPVGTPEARII